MNPQAQPTQWERTTTRRFLRWLFSWRTVRRALLLLAWMVTVIALFYGEENWRGRHAWNKYRQEQEARGAQFDLEAFIPPPVPDEQNFAATPLVRSWFPKGSAWDDNYAKVADKISNQQEAQEKGERHFNNLVAWQMAFDAARSDTMKKHQLFESTRFDRESRAQAAPAVLDGLKDDEPIWAELRRASQRPHSRYPVAYDLENPWGILLPHLGRIKSACQRLQLQASAELAAGQSDQALQDVKLTLYLADSVKDEVFLISFLVRAAAMQLASRPIWEGLAEHRWSESQLLALQTQLQRYDFLAGLRRPREAERAAVILTADLLYRQKYRLSDLSEPPPGAPAPRFGSGFANLVGQVAPHGWYHLEKLNACRLYQRRFGGTLDASLKRVSPRQMELDAHELEREISGGRLGKELNALVHHQVLAALLLPGLSQLPLKAAMAQTDADQAALACALERCRLVEGRFPDKLEALVPRFMPQLPKDALTGEPYKYRRSADDRFVLYSVGWDEKDDGGVPGKTLFDDKEGDWVWQYP